MTALLLYSLPFLPVAALAYWLLRKRAKWIRVAVAAGIWLGPAVVLSVIASGEDACLESAPAAISGLLPGMNKASLDKIDKYISMETATGEDDGGDYEEQIYHYSKYDIAVVRDIIDSITITSPELLWANKIKIGVDRNIVEKQIKVAPVVDEITSSQYVICSSAGDVYATFSYRDNKVTSIKISIDRP